MQRSPSLLGYSRLVEYIRQEQKSGSELKAAIDTAVKACISEGLIEDFLKLHSREVSGMLFRELTMEEFADIRAREAYGDGLECGAANKQREIAENLKKAGVAIETIAENTGLTVEEVEQL